MLRQMHSRIERAHDAFFNKASHGNRPPQSGARATPLALQSASVWSPAEFPATQPAAHSLNNASFA
jgi:hypothetical protein